MSIKSNTYQEKSHWFWGAVKKATPIYTQVIIATLFINLFALVVPLFVMNVYDRVVPNAAIDTLWVLAVGAIAIIGFDFLLRSIRSYLIDDTNEQLDQHLFSVIYQKLLNLPLSHHNKSVGNTANRVQNFENVREFLSASTITLLADIPFVIIFLLVIAYLAGPVVWVPVTLIPIVIATCIILQWPLSKLIKQNYAYGAAKQATLIETIAGIETIKTVNAQQQMQQQAEFLINKSAKLKTKIQSLSHAITHFSIFMQMLSSILVVVVGVYAIQNHAMTMGALVAVTILSGRALAPMINITRLISRYYQAKTSYQDLSSMMQTTNEMKSEDEYLVRDKLTGNIKFDNVNLHYEGQQLPTLQNININIKAGERVGIIGRNGSGKSSLLKLVSGLYQVNEGLVLLDGTNITQLNPLKLRSQMGYVPQDATLFSGSILENILLGQRDCDSKAVMQACDISGVSSFCSQHPEGLDRQVGERGLALSVGQRQSVALARALLNNPNMLLLDEPTSSMDDHSESLFKQRLAKQLENNHHTLVLITHRGSLLTLVDRLIVIEGGQVLMDGPRDKVIRTLTAKHPNSTKANAS